MGTVRIRSDKNVTVNPKVRHKSIIKTFSNWPTSLMALRWVHFKEMFIFWWTFPLIWCCFGLLLLALFIANKILKRNCMSVLEMFHNIPCVARFGAVSHYLNLYKYLKPDVRSGSNDISYWIPFLGGPVSSREVNINIINLSFYHLKRSVV